LKISIVTISYNSELHIRQTISSVLSQSYTNIEYIIIDGLSTDTTMKIVDEYKDEIDLIVSEQDAGMYDAYNKGAAAATGDYILYLNSDDYLRSDDAVETICRRIDEYEFPPRLVAGQANVVIDDVIIQNWRIPYSAKWSEKFDPMLPSLFIHKDIYKNIFFDSSCKLGGDTDFYQRLRNLDMYEISFVPILMTCFRMGGVSTNTQKIGYYALEKEMFLYNLTGEVFIRRLLLNYITGRIKMLCLRILGDRNYYLKVLYPLYLLRRKTL
jgi:glycosyltransferase involved in cell wall biosynthesis